MQSYLFSKEKDWTIEKAKEWFEKHKSEALHSHGLVFDLKFLTEKADPNARIFPWSMPARYYVKPGRMVIYGTALTAGQTRKGDIFSCEELRRGARSLIGGPIEVFEHTWDVGESRWLPFPDNAVLDSEEVDGYIEYIAGVSEPRVQQLIRDLVLNQVSVNAICRHVPADDPGQCNGMILNGFCLVSKDSLAASPGTSVKIWNCLRAQARRLEGVKPPETEVKNMTQKPEEGNTSQAPSQKTQQAPPPVTAHGPVAGVPEPSIEDRVKTLEEKFEGFRQSVETSFVQINAKLDTLIQTKATSPTIVAAPATASVQKTAAEWDTEYINDLPDNAFAVISSGGEKDDQGKTVPRTLRHLPHHKADGSLDLPHLRNALARMNQIEPASLQPEAKRHLCAHAKESDIVSEFCGEEPGEKTEKAPCKPCGSKTATVAPAETVIAAVKPIEPEQHMIVLTEQEILDVLRNKRLFTPALQLNGILDLLEAKKREAD